MRNKRAKLTLRDLGRLPVHVSADVPKKETLVQFAERLQREEEHEKQRPQRELEERVAATFEKLNEFSVKFWSQPLDAIKAAGPFATGAFVDLGLPLLPDSAPKDVAASAAREAFERYLQGLKTKGYTLAIPDRLVCFCQVLIEHGVWLTPQACAAGFDWLLKFVWEDGIASEELGVDESIVNPTAPEREKTFDEILSASGETREGDAAIRRALASEVMHGEFYSMMRQWYDSVHEQFGVVLSEVCLKSGWDFIVSHNLSPLKPATYDAARRHLVSRSLLPASCLTVREVLEQDHRKGTLTDREFLRQCQTYEQLGICDAPRLAASI
jgi:hypothetical protein